MTAPRARRYHARVKIPVLVGVTAACALGLGCASGGLFGGSNAHVVEPPKTITVQCGETYEWLPFDQTIVLEVPARNCWSTWMLIPHEAGGVDFRARGIVDVQYAFANGRKMTLVDQDPTKYEAYQDKITGVRYRNHGSQPVRIEVVLR